MKIIITVDGPAGSGKERISKFISKKYPKLSIHIKNNEMIRVAINLEYIHENQKIFANDEIAFFPPVSGG